MNKTQFATINEVARPCHNAAMLKGVYKVLVEGKTAVSVARALGLHANHLYAKCNRYRDLHAKLERAYGSLE